MKNIGSIFLPGQDKQILFFENRLDISHYSVLVLGSGSTNVSRYFDNKNNDVNLVVEDYDSLINSKLEIGDTKKIDMKLMDFERTDFPDNKFDLIYAQGSISNARRTKIVKEIKRILKTEGYFCLGEIVRLNENVPPFVTELFESSNLTPLFIDHLKKFYVERDFEIIDEIDLSHTLRDYYEKNIILLKEKVEKLNPSEKSYYKRILNQISHESNAYLKLGADKFIGFKSLLLKKKTNK